MVGEFGFCGVEVFLEFFGDDVGLFFVVGDLGDEVEGV